MVAGRQAESSAVGLSGEDSDMRSKNGVAQYMHSPLGRMALLINTSRVRNMSDATGNRFYESWRVLRALATQVGLRHFARARGLRLNLVPVSSIPRPSMIAFPLVLASACLMLPSCENTDRSGTTFRTFSALGGESISIDAHQRAIITTEVYDETGRSRLIYCAEPSPDAFASINSTLNRSIAAEVENRGEISAENIETLTSAASDALNARNATIQLLRDGLYRACEAYATGALSKNEYVGIVGQYQNVILALLSVELLTTINRREENGSEPETPEAGASKKGTSDYGFTGLGETSIAEIAQTAEDLVLRVLDIERERALQPRFAECVQRTRHDDSELSESLSRWCEIMLKHIAKESVSRGDDSGPTLDDLAEALVNPEGDVHVGEPYQVSLKQDDHLKVYDWTNVTNAVYEIDLIDKSPITVGDPALIIVKAETSEIINSDDDSGNGLDANITMQFAPGTYQILVINNAEEGTATFELLITQAQEQDAADREAHVDTQSNAEAVSANGASNVYQEGETEDESVGSIGSLEDLIEALANPDGNAFVERPVKMSFDKGERLKVYNWTNESDAIYEISLIDQSVLSVGDPALIVINADTAEILADDDDSGTGLNAVISMKFAPADYQLLIVNHAQDSTAAFELVIRQVEGQSERDHEARASALSRAKGVSPGEDGNV